jgi:hypothetical protein
MKTRFLVYLLGMAVSTFGQRDKGNMVPHMMHGVGVTFHEFDGLNKRISNFPQYKEVNDQMGTLQLGWLKEHKRFISGFSFTAGSSMSGDRDKRSSTIRFLGIGADFGYNVLNNPRVMVYPMAGIGYEKYQALFFRDNSTVDFNTLLQSPGAQNNLGPVDFKNSFLTYRLGAGFAFKSPRKPAHSIGLQAGYIASFRDHEWRSKNDQDLMNAPEDGLGRFFVTLTFLTQPGFMKH